jgi:hypothetical protein
LILSFWWPSVRGRILTHATMRNAKAFAFPIKVFFAVLISFLTLSLNAQEAIKIHVPDARFRDLLQSPYGIYFDTENNITNLEYAAKLKELRLSDITNLKGIEAFTSLELLECTDSQLSEVNVSSNKALIELTIERTQLTTIDVSANTALISLKLCCNQLTQLDVSSNQALEYLAGYSNRLTHLDVSSNTALKELTINDNQLTHLNVSANHQLAYLDCDHNQLSQLDISNNKLLRAIDCSHNQLTDLNFWNLRLSPSSFGRQQEIYAGNHFPSHYNSFYPLQKNQVIELLWLLPLFVIYQAMIFFLLFQKDEDRPRNRRQTAWIILANIILLPAWYIYLAEPFIPSNYMDLVIAIPFGLLGMLVQLKSLIRKTRIVIQQKKFFILSILAIAALYFLYQVANYHY